MKKEIGEIGEEKSEREKKNVQRNRSLSFFCKREHNGAPTIDAGQPREVEGRNNVITYGKCFSAQVNEPYARTWKLVLRSRRSPFSSFAKTSALRVREEVKGGCYSFYLSFFLSSFSFFFPFSFFFRARGDRMRMRRRLEGSERENTIDVDLKR